MNELTAFTEGDVEHKIVWSILTKPSPQGLGIPPSNIHVKRTIRSYTIGKGRSQKIYVPDFIVVLSGLPLVVIEAKAPKEDISVGFREARMYAQELNAAFPARINPVKHVLAFNGLTIEYGVPDQAAAVLALEVGDLDSTNVKFAQLCSHLRIDHLISSAEQCGNELRAKQYHKPVHLIGGHSVRNEELGHNSFGQSIAIEYRGLFNPTSRADRALIVREAYIKSKRRERYVEPIDRIIRAATPPHIRDARQIEDTTDPKDVIEQLKKLRPLEHQIMLLIGSVGSGKTTFVDYLREVALPDDLRKATLWCHLNMNAAPISPDKIYDWLCDEIVSQIKLMHPEVDFDELETIQSTFGIEISTWKKGLGKLYADSSQLYSAKLAEHLQSLLADRVRHTHAYIRHYALERQRLMIVVLDNCDKRIRDEQLLMFQAAEWIQKQFNCLVVLPLREETYDNHKHQPPLDTAIKDLVFVIEPPLFQSVLTRRIQLAIHRMSQSPDRKRTLTIELPNGFHFAYPAAEQAYFLTSVLHSIFAHDMLIRRMIVGLSGRNMRKAMEMFLDFCSSGHITEDHIFKIRQTEGRYVMPEYLVMRVLLRASRRFYDGELSYVKNLFALEPRDPIPTYFLRVTILKCLHKHFTVPGPSGVEGYMQVLTLKSRLTPYGFSNSALDREVLFLLKSQCIIAEHLRTDGVSDEDLIRLAPAGFVHLDMFESLHYVAAIAEDTWYEDRELADEIGRRITSDKHHHPDTVVKNARDLLNCLKAAKSHSFPAAATFLEKETWTELVDVTRMENSIARGVEWRVHSSPWFDIERRLRVGMEVEGLVANRTDRHGLFIEIADGITGLAPRATLPKDYASRDDFLPGETVKVSIQDISEARRKVYLRLVDCETE